MREALASAVVLAACSSGIGEPAAPQPSSPDATADTAPSVAREPGTGDTVDLQTLLSVGSCWFEKPYDYMFEGSGVTIHGMEYGMLVAGIGGILYYGDLNTCMGKVKGVAPKSYSDNSPFEAMSGLPVLSDKMDESKPFGFYNPDIVKWGHENLVPPADMTVAGVPACDIYDKVFSRFFRMMTESYVYLVDSGTYRKERTAYWEMATKTNQDGIEYLQSRFKSALPHYGGAWDGTTMTPQMAIGFWLRRGLDGTEAELWTGLRKVMGRFDPEWYSGLRKTYPSGDIEW